ncbi:GPA3 [Scenedesmus sp. PABB004]|nr:GPA3 [Scenedesmus sp. PABB004]
MPPKKPDKAEQAPECAAAAARGAAARGAGAAARRGARHAASRVTRGAAAGSRVMQAQRHAAAGSRATPPAARRRRRPGLASELAALAAANQDLELGHAMMVDKARQLKAENERLLADVAACKARIAAATHDCQDILAFRQEQARAADARGAALAQQLERLQAELAGGVAEIARLKARAHARRPAERRARPGARRATRPPPRLQEANAAQAAQLDDAAGLLQDKERLEAAVKEQHALIESRGTELRVARAHLDAKDAALDKARSEIAELSMRCQAATQLRILFGEPWLVATSRHRLKGSVPHDREFNALAALAGGKQLVLHGGQSRSHEGVARETAVLSLDTLTWEQPDGAAATQPAPLLGHTATAVGGRKLLVFGGSTGDEATSAAMVLPDACAAQHVRWTAVASSGPSQPSPRLCHAAAALRDKVLVFGGMSYAGLLLNDVWSLDLESGVWSHLSCHSASGAVPSPRKGASLCATDDGRRLYLVGGHDGRRHLPPGANPRRRVWGSPQNDVHYLDVERLVWSAVTPSGVAPEPREGHAAAVLGGKYLVVSGGCGAAAPAPAAQLQAPGSGAADGGDGGDGGAGGGRRLTDTHVLSIFDGPAWEQLDDGEWAKGLVWLKQARSARAAASGRPERVLCAASCTDRRPAAQSSCATAVHGSRLYTLLPNVHEQLDEVMITELTLPEDIARLAAAGRRRDEQARAPLRVLRCTRRAKSLGCGPAAPQSARAAAAGQVERLELLPDARAVTASSVEVAWRPPSKNSERITSYKLMVASRGSRGVGGQPGCCRPGARAGVAREAYSGRALSRVVGGLRPGTEVICCVKATYDDGSFAWSESHAYSTRG